MIVAGHIHEPQIMTTKILLCTLLAVAAAITLPEYIDRCEADLASDKSSECGIDAVFCTGYAFIGHDLDGFPERKTGCRPCEVMPAGAQADSAVHDPLNVCNCGGGQYCRHTGLAVDPDNREIGYCTASTLIGTPCNTTENCRGPREDSTDGGAARREVGFCVQHKCAQCEPDKFSDEMGSPQHVCPGYTRLPDGTRLYHNSMPGMVVTCSADGTLTTSGQPNFELKAGDAPPEAISEGNGKSDEEPGYVLGLLVANLIFVVIVTVLLTLLAVLGYFLWRKRVPAHRMK